MPESNLKVAVMPHDIIENDAKANIEAVSRRISSIDPDTDLLVLLKCSIPATLISGSNCA